MSKEKIFGLAQMLSEKSIRKAPKKHRLSLHPLRKHVHRHHSSSEHAENPPQPSKTWTPEEIQQRRVIEQHIFTKLEVYANKPRIWQITHSSHIKQRLLNQSPHISRHYSIPQEFVHDCINQLFLKIDRYVLHARQLVHSTSRFFTDSSNLLQKAQKPNNQWRSFQLERAQAIFPDLDFDEYTPSELLQKYCTHIIQTLTPKPDSNSTNCIAQLREQAFDLNLAYEQSEKVGKDYLRRTLDNYHQRTIPDLRVIEEMVDLGTKNRQTFSRKISMLVLLRFGTYEILAEK